MCQAEVGTDQEAASLGLSRQQIPRPSISLRCGILPVLSVGRDCGPRVWIHTYLAQSRYVFEKLTNFKIR